MGHFLNSFGDGIAVSSCLPPALMENRSALGLDRGLCLNFAGNGDLGTDKNIDPLHSASSPDCLSPSIKSVCIAVVVAVVYVAESFDFRTLFFVETFYCQSNGSDVSNVLGNLFCSEVFPDSLKTAAAVEANASPLKRRPIASWQAASWNITVQPIGGNLI